MKVHTRSVNAKKTPFIFKGIRILWVVLFSGFLAITVSINKAGAKQKLTLKSQNPPVGFLWLSVDRHLDQNNVSFLFSCDRQNQLRITLRDPGQPDHIKGLLGIIRLITNNTPPSGEGYKKFIYVARFSQTQKSLSIRPRDVPHFLEDLNTLKGQVMKNQEQGAKEYDEKIKYCERLPQKSQQKCFESSSAYQPRPPVVAIWVEADEARRPLSRFNSLFDPKDLEPLKKLPCYSR